MMDARQTEVLEMLPDSLLAAQKIADSLEESPDDAIEWLKACIKHEVWNADWYQRLAICYTKVGRFKEAEELYDEALATMPALTLLRGPEFLVKQAAGAEKGIPPVFINTQFKSASMFILNTLCAGLDVSYCHISMPGVTRDILPGALNVFAKGGAVSQAHTPATPGNLALLQSAGVDRFVVHTRDPRQQALSAIHHWQRCLADGTEFEKAEASKALCWDCGFEQLVDQYLERHFEKEVQWVSDWVCAADRNDDFDILVTRYEDLVTQGRQFFETLLEFLRIPAEQFDWGAYQERPQSGQMHFRKGLTDEWKTVYTKEQAEKATAMIPDGLLVRMNWPRQ